ncbi:hypothetical protein Fmac_007405 [Flemingia macrophylla]|uniref:Uncharacterized protein n=1 Tax=Flemingia macrophylla TaxID=520843 RepID=A0ABD1MUG2_9FABA
MANSLSNHHLVTVLLLFLLLTSSSATARPLNLALPSDTVAPPEEGHLRVAGKKFGPLVLNMLPKGPVPPSGPSKGTNGLNN